MAQIDRKTARQIAAKYAKAHRYTDTRLLTGLHQGAFQNASYVFELIRPHRAAGQAWPLYLYIDTETGATMTQQGPWV
ncbi:hypothetical protein [Lacticaseibacillus absianus]|uniref:hypothetical protein n=1 Tax=Lacticaseibacillus absianus TaxID=2729623 RepID=UPI0015CADE0B|nr:hypothetical protein [Lacticaseibacillus absianus]